MRPSHKEMVYAFLRRDADLLAQFPPGQEPPSPLLYDPEIHRQHRHGAYRPLKNDPLPRPLLRLPNRADLPLNPDQSDNTWGHSTLPGDSTAH